ncbi:c-type cytochrome [Beggiatoa leptomitoformis]|uniref:Cytochrome c domain-containing protein n=1 Tax=Beggiatoa leptomitoformis TaxID=288004 RepID=A0A2N9YIW5_9GAMM|nr:hypothetical protein [Beggiatoa leptomitoformis]AUI70295.1 hypothetical protein BLE401_17375 [Beggiatoa leptomitoformis]QGX03618.1 hypothetical protein AL038_18750 [Beggiatoa leptomitoformis]
MKLSHSLLIGLVAASTCLFTGTSMAAETDEQTDILLLISRSGCLNCHDLTPQAAKATGSMPFGPPYVEVAKRYKDDPKAFDMLLTTVKNGSNPYKSHWKDKVSGIAMPPMVTVTEENAKRLLTWILSLDEKSAAAAEAQLAGQKIPTITNKTEDEKEILLLISHSGCLNCHDLTRQTAAKESNPMPFGPPYVEVAKRYKDDPKAFEMLLNTVKNGSNPYKSHWKDKVSGIAMPPMVTVTEENAKRLLTWILSLDDEKASHAEMVLAGKEKP